MAVMLVIIERNGSRWKFLDCDTLDIGQRRGIVTLRHCNTFGHWRETRDCDIATLRHCDIVTLRHCDIVTLWHRHKCSIFASYTSIIVVVKACKYISKNNCFGFISFSLIVFLRGGVYCLMSVPNLKFKITLQWIDGEEQFTKIHGDF